MTAHADPWMLCDGCESEQYPQDAGESAFIDAGIRELRRAAKEDGWTYRRGVGDLCPACTEKQGT